MVEIGLDGKRTLRRPRVSKASRPALLEWMFQKADAASARVDPTASGLPELKFYLGILHSFIRDETDYGTKFASKVFETKLAAFERGDTSFDAPSNPDLREQVGKLRLDLSLAKQLIPRLERGQPPTVQAEYCHACGINSGHAYGAKCPV